MKSYINLDDGSNLTEISPILTCLRTLNESEALWDRKPNKLESLSLKQLRSETLPNEDGFCFAVSLQDGSTLYMSSAITTHLGYPKDMLVGQCIMNFLYQKDHITFANHLTQGLNACFIQGKRDDSHLVPNTFFCRLREYHGLKYGFAISDKKTQYKPFKVTLHINDLIFDDVCVEKYSSTLCVKATATPVNSAYTIPEEIPAMTSFSTRHTASCHFSHVDASAIPYLGYLPQDMIGYSVFDFYHIDDMPLLKDIYELVVKEKGTSFRSKPYYFKVQNGCYILLETEWSCFINPWSRKLEFVVGQHRVLKGPTDINIFNLCEEEKTVSEEILKESISIQKEIKGLLSQPIQSHGIEKKRFCNKRKRDLASFVYNCIDKGIEWSKQESYEKMNSIDDASNSDSESVVMGDISPFREVNDSSISSETPPTVQQMRCQENIERFFASRPKTYSDGSDEYNKSEKCSTGEEYQTSSSASGNASKDQNASHYETKVQESSSNSSKCNMSSFTTGDSGYKSTEKEANSKPSTSNAEMSNHTWNYSDSYKNKDKLSTCLALTEESLCVHNQMNHKIMKHRKIKTSYKQQAEPNHNKHKKCSHDMMPPDKVVPQTPYIPFSSGNTSTPVANQQVSQQDFESRPYLFPPANTTPPFFIPVVYMGTMPYYPPISNVFPQTGTPFWSNAPSNPTPTPGMLTPGFPLHSTNMNPFSSIPFGFQSSGVTTTSLVATTTTTVASDRLCTNKDMTVAASKTVLSKVKVPEVKTDIIKDFPMDITKDDMLVEDTHSSILTPSSSPKSTDKEEDMDFEVKFPSAPRTEKIKLTPDVIYRYQMAVPNIEDILKKDMEFLKNMQQPDVVNKQLQILHEEMREEDEMKVNTESNFCITESIMLGLTTEDDVKEELEFWEERHLQNICDDV